MTGIAKGAKRSQKRFVNKLELFSSLCIRYRESRGSNLVFIVEAELLESFIPLRQSMPLYMVATVFRELTLAASRDLEGEDGLFALLQWGLQSLDGQRSALTVLVFFQIKFFEQIGYRPTLDSCLCCHHLFDATQDYGFDCRGGGIVCKHCQKTQGQTAVLPLSRGTIRILESAQNQPLNRLHRLRLSVSTLHEALSLLHHYGRHLLQREICSLQLLSDTHWQG